MFWKNSKCSNKAAGDLVWTSPLVIYLRNHTVFAPVFMLLPDPQDTQWVSLWHLLLPAQCCSYGDQGPMGCLPFQLLHSNLSLEAVLSHGHTQLWFLKVRTHSRHLDIWRRHLSSAGSLMGAEAGPYHWRIPAPHTLQKQAPKCVCLMRVGEVPPVTRMQLVLSWWNVWNVRLLSLKFLKSLCSLWNRVKIL